MNGSKTSEWVEGYKHEPEKDAQLHVEGREPKLVSVKWPWRVINVKAKSKG